MAKYNYVKNPLWVDHIEDEENGIVIQKGTPHTAKKMNNMDEGISQANRNANEVTDDLAKHKEDKYPHIIEDLKNDKKYKYGMRVGENGRLQLIYEEVL